MGSGAGPRSSSRSSARCECSSPVAPNNQPPTAADARERLIETLKRQVSALNGGRAGALAPDHDRLDLMLELYGCPADEIAEAVVPRFVADRRELLAELFDAYRDDPRATPLLASDSLLIFERLEHDPDRLRDFWQRHRLLDELEDLASVYGVAI